MNPLADLAKGIVGALITSGAAVIADQGKAEADVLEHLHRVMDPALRTDYVEARRLAKERAGK